MTLRGVYILIAVRHSRLSQDMDAHTSPHQSQPSTSAAQRAYATQHPIKDLQLPHSRGCKPAANYATTY